MTSLGFELFQEFLTELYAIWDIESFNIPKKYTANQIFDRIIRFLNSQRFTEKFSVEAVVAKYTEERITDVRRLELEMRGVRFIYIHSGSFIFYISFLLNYYIT